MNMAGKTYKMEEKTRLTMLYKITLVNKIRNVPNKEILIPADTRTRRT